jgi:hypothetical protein
MMTNATGATLVCLGPSSGFEVRSALRRKPAAGGYVRVASEARRHGVDDPDRGAGGPKIALTLATLGVEVPSRQIQDRSGPKPMPFGKVFFLEVASPWSGVLDLRDAEVIKIVEGYRKKK